MKETGVKKEDAVFRKIAKEEFDKLKALFPDSDEKWEKYRISRLEQFDRQDADVYVIEYRGEFVGEVTVNYSSHELAAETVPNQRVYFEAFRVDRRYQGMGLGQELLRYALSDLEDRGFTEFTIGVEEDNKTAGHIYSKFGFTMAIDKGHGNEYDPCDYILYMRKIT